MKLRIVEETKSNGDVEYVVDMFTSSGNWINVSSRGTLESAEEAVNNILGNRVVSKKVIGEYE